MKNYLYALLLTVVLLGGCSGSDFYQGRWKATDTNGNHLEITFEPKNLQVKDSTGKAINYAYTQNGITIENSVRTYGIQLKDGRHFNLFFPLKNDATKGIILLGNNEPVYTISRNAYLTYQDLYKLTKQWE